MKDVWERDDIGDYLWIDIEEIEQYGVSIALNDSINQQASKKWLDFPQREKLLSEAIKTYQEIIKINTTR